MGRVTRASFWFGLVAVVVSRIFLMNLVPPVADESYYLLWAAHLDWSYVDHPGLVAWIQQPIRWFISEPLFAARLTALACFVGGLLFVYGTVWLWYHDRRLARTTTLFFSLIPIHFLVGIPLQVEQPLILFTTASIFCFVALIRSQNPWVAFPLSISMGLALLSKYTAILPLVGMLGILIAKKSCRGLLKSWQFGAAAGLFLVIIFPIVGWNASHDWISFNFHLSRVGKTGLFAYFFDFLFVQLIYCSPVLWAALWATQRNASLRTDPLFRMMLVLTVVCWVPFAILGITTRVWGHWAAIATIPAVILVSQTLRNRNWLKAGAAVSVMLTVIVCFSGPNVIGQATRYLQNYHLKGVIDHLVQQKGGNLPIITDFHGATGQLTVFARRKVYMATSMAPELWGARQFNKWGTVPVIEPGESVLFIGDRATEPWLNQQFESVKILAERLYVMESHIRDKPFYYCEFARRRVQF